MDWLRGCRNTLRIIGLLVGDSANLPLHRASSLGFWRVFVLCTCKGLAGEEEKKKWKKLWHGNAIVQRV